MKKNYFEKINECRFASFYKDRKQITKKKYDSNLKLTNKELENYTKFYSYLLKDKYLLNLINIFEINIGELSLCIDLEKKEEYFKKISKYILENNKKKEIDKIFKQIIDKKLINELQLLINLIKLDDYDIENDPILHYILKSKNYFIFEELLKTSISFEIKNKKNQNLFHICISHGNFNIMQKLLKKSKNYDLKDIHGETPLLISIRKKEIKILELLIKNNIDIDKTNNLKFTPLMTAINTKNLDIIKTILKKNPDLNKKNKIGDTALIISIKSKLIEISKLLLNYENININEFNNKMDCALILACSNNLIDTVKFIFEKKNVNFNCQDKFLNTPLIICLRKKYFEIAQLLIDKNVDLNVKNRYGKTALFWAMRNNNKRITDILIKKLDCLKDKNLTKTKNPIYSIKNENVVSHIIIALQSKKEEFVKDLFKNNKNILQNLKKDKKIEDLIFLCIKRNNLEILELFINNVDINIKNSEGDTPLLYSVKNENIEMIKLLLKNKADVEKYDKEFKNALFIAIEAEKIEIVKLLIKNHAKIIQKNPNENTIKNNPLKKAILQKDTNILFYLLQKLKEEDKLYYQASTFFIAIENNDLKKTKLLLDFGINVNITDESGLTALMLACKNGNSTMINLLIKYKADIDLTDNTNFSAFFYCLYLNDEINMKIFLKRKCKIFCAVTFLKILFYNFLKNKFIIINKVFEFICLDDEIQGIPLCFYLSVGVGDINFRKYLKEKFSNPEFDSKCIFGWNRKSYEKWGKKAGDIKYVFIFDKFS